MAGTHDPPAGSKRKINDEDDWSERLFEEDCNGQVERMARERECVCVCVCLCLCVSLSVSVSVCEISRGRSE